MSEKVDIWMPFYVADYLADTMHLSVSEHGAYLMLILHYWRTGPLPDDDARLATISKLGDAWSNASSTLRAFFKHSSGMLVHSRIEREKLNSIDNKERNKARALHAANKRWGKDAPSMPQALLEDMLEDMLEECPSPSPSSKHIKTKPMSDKSDAIEILEHLNFKASRSFRPVDSNLKLIRARLAEGATKEDCIKVIDIKVSDWLTDIKMSQYLRPETLFNATKFAQYIGSTTNGFQGNPFL